MSSCNKISELLSAYIDNEVTAKEKEMVELHIKECTSCKQKLDVMTKTKDILKATPQIPVPETLLKDFEEYRKKSEQTEKKVVPLYKNYRVYASVAAVFIFAFVLKSGLWQEDKYLPDLPNKTGVTEQTIDAPVNNDDHEVSEVKTASEVKPESKAKEKAVVAKPVDQAKPAEEKAVSPQSEPTTVVQNNAKVVPEVQPESANHAPAVAEVTVEADTMPVADEPQAATMTRTREIPEEVNEVEEKQETDHAIVYVAEEHLAKAANLLSEGHYFYAQVEQKLGDNRIPFESNYLSLDEGIPHKVVVMVKE